MAEVERPEGAAVTLARPKHELAVAEQRRAREIGSQGGVGQSRVLEKKVRGEDFAQRRESSQLRLRTWIGNLTACSDSVKPMQASAMFFTFSVFANT